eukprot:scaffold99063_cov74-Cyclotella_meneghiniana.AAC.1
MRVKNFVIPDDWIDRRLNDGNMYTAILLWGFFLYLLEGFVCERRRGRRRRPPELKTMTVHGSPPFTRDLKYIGSNAMRQIKAILSNARALLGMVRIR